MPLPRETFYTMDDIYRLPDGQRAELIHGQLFMMAPPNRLHQKLVMELSATIRQYIKEHGGVCEVYPAPFAVYLNEAEDIYVEPDISIICDKNKLTETGCKGAPDFVIEIVSPGSKKMDYITKNTLYSEAGVREYWIVDPAVERTMIYQYEEDATPMIIPFECPIGVGLYGDLQIQISALLE